MFELFSCFMRITNERKLPKKFFKSISDNEGMCMALPCDNSRVLALKWLYTKLINNYFGSSDFNYHIQDFRN